MHHSCLLRKKLKPAMPFKILNYFPAQSTLHSRCSESDYLRDSFSQRELDLARALSLSRWLAAAAVTRRNHALGFTYKNSIMRLDRYICCGRAAQSKNIIL
jgi:hypothetical protein